MLCCSGRRCRRWLRPHRARRSRTGDVRRARRARHARSVLHIPACVVRRRGGGGGKSRCRCGPAGERWSWGPTAQLESPGGQSRPRRIGGGRARLNQRRLPRLGPPAPPHQDPRRRARTPFRAHPLCAHFAGGRVVATIQQCCKAGATAAVRDLTALGALVGSSLTRRRCSAFASCIPTTRRSAPLPSQPPARSRTLRRNART